MTGISTLTYQQALEVIAVLVRNFTAPGLGSFAETGFYINGANQWVIPDNAYNQALANNLNASPSNDGSRIHVSLITGNPASGS
jgi:hypothetical protein